MYTVAMNGPKPKRRRLTLEDMRLLAKARGGACVSEKYVSSMEHLQWECGLGHRWNATPSNVMHSKSWCPVCSGNAAVSLASMQTIASAKGGECLWVRPTKAGRRGMAGWRCTAGHEWEATPSNVRNRGSWCPECCRIGSSVGERITRRVLSAMFQAPFPKARPSWLIGPYRRRLELDGFCLGLGLAFEYQGPQHYESNWMYPPEVVRAVQERDAVKTRLCRENNITLIVVPDFKNPNELSGCIDQIEHAVLWAGVAIPKRWKRPESLPGLHDPLQKVFGEDGLEALQALAAKRGGALISNFATRKGDKLEWRCAKEHVWPAQAKKIKIGRWCPFCSGRKQWTEPKQ